MNLGVLLLYCQEGRGTNFTREWAARAVQRVADYMFAQSGGRETITFKVYDWIKLPLTEAQWSGLGMNAYSSLRATLEEEVGESFDPYTHILIGIDHSQSSGGTTPGAITHLAASNFFPSIIAHELGHRYGADDAFGETAQGPVRYQNRFCVMGGDGWPAVFADETIADPRAPMLNLSGPGMSAPTLIATKWLDESAHKLGVDLTNSDLFTGGRVEQLSALAGAPGPGWTRPPLVIRYQDLLIEYRVRANDGWDRGLPDPGTNAGGWLVVHRSPVGAPVATYVDSVAASPGAVLVVGKDDPLNIFNPGPLRLSVLSFDAAARTVRFQLSRRAARPSVSGTIYGGVRVGGAGLVWTPGRGFKRIPPHSPLLSVLNEVARIQDLEETMAIASADEVRGLMAEASQALRSLQRSVTELRIEPSVSPLAHALESISQLHHTSEGLDASTDGGKRTREFVEASRRQLDAVKRILAAAVDEEGQR